MRLARAKAGRSLPLVTALLLAALVLSAGLSWALLRPVRYQSSATLVLAPAPVDSKAVPSLLDSYQRSGTIGTFVELLSSSDVWGRAGYPPVSITVRAIPDTRAINVRASGEQQRAVQPGLAAVIRAATASQGQLGDLWQLRVLEGVSDPREAAPERRQVVIAAVVLALLAGLFGYLAGRRLRSWFWSRDDSALERQAAERFYVAPQSHLSSTGD